MSSIPMHIRLEKKKIVLEQNMPLISASVRVSAMAVLFWRLTAKQTCLSRTEPLMRRVIGRYTNLNTSTPGSHRAKPARMPCESMSAG